MTQQGIILGISVTTRSLCLYESIIHLLLTNLNSQTLINIINSSSLNSKDTISWRIPWLNIRQKSIKCTYLHKRYLAIQMLQILLGFYYISLLYRSLLFLFRVSKFILGWDTELVLASWNHLRIWFVYIEFYLWSLWSRFVVYHVIAWWRFYFLSTDWVIKHILILL